MKKLVDCTRRAIDAWPAQRRRRPQGPARRAPGEVERAKRAVQGDRQRLLRRNRRACVLSDHVAEGSYADRYRPSGGNVADKANIEKLGFKVADIKYLLNTHAHFDHTGGLAEMKKDTGAQIVASEADKPLLEGGYYPGSAEGDGARVSAGESRPHGPRRRHGHGGRGHADRPRNARPFAGLHELELPVKDGDPRVGADFLQRHRGAQPARRPTRPIPASSTITERRSRGRRT